MTKDAYAKKTGRWILAQRTRLGMTQAELADAIEISDTSISNWEAGRGVLSAYSLGRLRVFFASRPGSSKTAPEADGVAAS